MLNDLSDAVEDFVLPVTVTRYVPATFDHGLKVDEVSCYQFIAHLVIFPLTQKELNRLPAGTKSDGAVRVMSTKDRLYTVRTSDAKQADTFLYNGVTHQITKVDDWNDLGGFYDMVALRLDR